MNNLAEPSSDERQDKRKNKKGSLTRSSIALTGVTLKVDR